MDGHQLSFRRQFDAVFTNAALHWMKQPEAVVAGVANYLKRAGSSIAEFGAKGNVSIVRSALHVGLRRHAIDTMPIDPWYYASPEEYSALPSKAGFIVNYIDLIPRPTKLPGDILDWLEIFAHPF